MTEIGDEDHIYRGAAAPEDRVVPRQTSGGAAERAAAIFAENPPPDDGREHRWSLPSGAEGQIATYIGTLRNNATAGQGVFPAIDRLEAYLVENMRPISMVSPGEVFNDVSSPPAPIYAVYDWAYRDPISGEDKYARTPERADKLRRDGVKLTPVYTRAPDVSPMRRAELDAAAKYPELSGQPYIHVDTLAAMMAESPDWLARHKSGSENGDPGTLGKVAYLLLKYRKSVWNECTAAVRKLIDTFITGN